MESELGVSSTVFFSPCGNSFLFILFWKLNLRFRKSIKVLGMKCLRTIIRVKWFDRMRNHRVRPRIWRLIGAKITLPDAKLPNVNNLNCKKNVYWY